MDEFASLRGKWFDDQEMVYSQKPGGKCGCTSFCLAAHKRGCVLAEQPTCRAPLLCVLTSNQQGRKLADRALHMLLTQLESKTT